MSIWSSSTSASKSWSSGGTFAVKAQARCATHTSVLSDLSGGLSVTIKIPPYPDLTGEWTYLDQVCKNGSEGLKCKVVGSLRVDNVGNKAASSFVVTIRVPDGERDFVKSRKIRGPMKAGGSVEVPFSIALPVGFSASGLPIIGIIDSGSHVIEVTEADNFIRGFVP